MKIKIHVTKEVLERSKMCGLTKEIRMFSTNCAVAIAVRDIFPNAQVYGLFIDTWFGDDVLSRNIDLPKEVTKFIDSFDEKTPEERVNMRPISFEVDVPDYVIEKIGIEQAYKILESSPTLELVKPQQP
jgi:hypothetical protein